MPQHARSQRASDLEAIARELLASLRGTTPGPGLKAIRRLEDRLTVVRLELEHRRQVDRDVFRNDAEDAIARFRASGVMDNARAAWDSVVGALRTAPIPIAHAFAREIRADLDSNTTKGR